MTAERRFLVASSIARLVCREHREFSRVVEGYFPARVDRIQWVRVERDQSHLVLRTQEGGEAREEEHELPLSHAAALMDVAAGRIAYDRTSIILASGVTANLDRHLLPAGLDLLTVSTASNPRFFVPPAWVGPEVTENLDFDGAQLALQGRPTVNEIEVQNVAVEALLDWLDRPTEVVTEESQPHTAAAQPVARPAGSAQAHGPVEQPVDRSIGSVASAPARSAVFREQPHGLEDGVMRLARSLDPGGLTYPRIAG